MNMDIVFLGLVLDGFVLAALMIAVYFAIYIIRSLNAFKIAREDMASQILQLNKTLADAENAVKSLKSESVNASGGLRDIMNQAKNVAGELDILIQSGNRLADRLDGGLSPNKIKNKPFRIHDENHAKRIVSKPNRVFETKAEQDLYDALQQKKKGTR